jgi:hypothetical protein
LIERDYIEDHRRHVSSSIRLKNPQFYQSIDPNFKELSRGIIEIAVSLNHRNDMKDLFLDLVEKVFFFLLSFYLCLLYFLNEYLLN